MPPKLSCCRCRDAGDSHQGRSLAPDDRALPTLKQTLTADLEGGSAAGLGSNLALQRTACCPLPRSVLLRLSQPIRQPDTTMTTKKTRTETDTFGPIEVVAEKYWRAQAQRSLGNFKIGWERQPLAIVRALGIVKRAAAETNMALGALDKKTGETMVAAAQEVIDGKLDEHFPLVVWQTGSGT